MYVTEKKLQLTGTTGRSEMYINKCAQEPREKQDTEAQNAHRLNIDRMWKIHLHYHLPTVELIKASKRIMLPCNRKS